MKNQNPGCLGVLLRLFAPASTKKPVVRPDSVLQSFPETPEIYPYRLRDDFLSPAETSFYLVLKSMLGERLVICPQVSLAGLFFPVGDDRQTYQNKIDRKRVDFVLCDPKTLKPILAIELDDASHRRPDRQERDAFVEKVFENARLPLARVPVRSVYDPRELAAILQTALKNQPVPQASAPTAETGAPICPKCGVSMVRRVAKRGNTPGQPFWGCPNYPRCREMLADSAPVR